MSKYFNESELACNGVECEGLNNVGNGIDPRLFDVLDAIRERIGQPIYVNSGYRCPVHNRNVGGVPNSQHVDGTAADITYDGIDVDYLAQVAEECGADGIGRYWSQSFVHVDTRGSWARWTEND
jgi:uncharacterized protein YcbK (DUF882 family)